MKGECQTVQAAPLIKPATAGSKRSCSLSSQYPRRPISSTAGKTNDSSNMNASVRGALTTSRTIPRGRSVTPRMSAPPAMSKSNAGQKRRMTANHQRLIRRTSMSRRPWSRRRCLPPSSPANVMPARRGLAPPIRKSSTLGNDQTDTPEANRGLQNRYAHPI